MSDFKRSDRIGPAIQRLLSEFLPRLKMPPPGLVTFQEVRVASDLSHAKVYYTVLGAEVEDAQENLKHNAGSLRHMLSKEMKLRTVPELHFVHDATLEEGNRLQGLIEKAVESDRHADEQSPEETEDR
ncbi:30S ribosome-binding factor RbfA [Solemya velum gill symbiont]|uniref:Ribosome-binding factor A n=1 Tax=Solemya velum gill symbiont TaxID=2340 RepID=A0A0B0HET7_SOVGS|nr:30S ribosome-binding factor RbfA [Solemya velum gill symbiont]KHF25966.1 ribosome-binding factor A [Solemya velum gill symbiont]OOY34480.1 ribosome-binding factor A [Solemya velum gill symbiont]OOY37192.1 ribosome-binding factor A [Solemya velum gill symbiont]OOY41205.1 ribosome-binding factor A [Solemya velum gill symbiont]OOY41247.1 ribosome-binding factor A [Solemya velum gill symbiont]